MPWFMPEGATYQHGAASFTCFMVEVECESHSTREFGTRCLLGLLEKYEGAGDSASFADVFSFEDTQQESSCARAKFFLRGREQKCNIAFAYASRLPADEGPCGNFGRAQCQEVSGDKLAFCPMSHTHRAMPAARQVSAEPLAVIDIELFLAELLRDAPCSCEDP